MNPEKLTVSASPHFKAGEGTRSIMLDVIIALMPALVGSVYFFGFRALTFTAVSAAGAVFFEWLYRKLMHKTSSIGDLSAVVTGILLAYCCPVTMPYWMVLAGDAIAIIIVKQLYGGIGKNFMNPALVGRVFLFSWPVFITRFTYAFDKVSVFGSNVDAVTAATPLGTMSTGVLPESYNLADMFFGKMPGCLGEVSAALLILGGIYLVIRKVIALRIPVAFILTVAVVTFLFPRGNDRVAWMLCNVLSGGLILGAIFMATDYATSPITKRGQWIYGVGCGLLTVFIRYFGSYPEGVSFSILVMNACAWLIDKAGMPKRFGEVKAKKEAAK